ASGEFRLPAAPRPVKGYLTPGDQVRKKIAQRIVLRYFRMLYEFIARYVVAYVVDNGLLESPGRVNLKQLVLQLRGQGWGLHPTHDPSDRMFGGLAAQVSAQVAARARELLSARGISPDALGFADPARYHVDDPKLTPVRQAVGRDGDPNADLRSGRS